eukprot:1141507-Pelagomonas_calceolata.AAC.4
MERSTACSAQRLMAFDGAQYEQPFFSSSFVDTRVPCVLQRSLVLRQAWGRLVVFSFRCHFFPSHLPQKRGAQCLIWRLMVLSVRCLFFPFYALQKRGAQCLESGVHDVLSRLAPAAHSEQPFPLYSLKHIHARTPTHTHAHAHTHTHAHIHGHAFTPTASHAVAPQESMWASGSAGFPPGCVAPPPCPQCASPAHLCCAAGGQPAVERNKRSDTGDGNWVFKG